MKIVIPLLGFGRAGGQRVLSRLASELTSLGHEVYIVVPNDGMQPYYPTSAKIIKTKKKRTKFRLFNLFYNYLYLWLGIKKIKADIVIANHHLTAYIVALLPKRIEKYYYIQAYEVVFGYNIFSKVLAYCTYLLPLKKIVNSETILPKNINKFIDVVPAGIDTEVYYPRGKAKKNPLNIGLVGRKEQHKGTKEIITAICSWGGDKDIIVNVAVFLSDSNKSLLEENKIDYRYYEILDDEQLSDFYRLNDLVIATGLVEDGAFHYPCAEAMACGCVVISNYAPLVRSNSPYKLKEFNSELLKNKLDLFLSASEDNILKEIEENINIISQYSWGNVSRKFNACIIQKENHESN